MPKKTNKHFLILASLVLILNACYYKAPEDEKTRREKQKANAGMLLKSVQGIKYYEVKRQFDNGLSISADGYKLNPSWNLSFSSADSVYIYNATRHLYNNAPVMFDHDSIFNLAWSWVRLQKLSKDSLKFKVLNVEDQIIIHQKQNVYMTFYSDNYIKQVLHTDIGTLRRPDRNDTLYIKRKAELSNANKDSAFAALEPVVLRSTNPQVKISKLKVEEDAISELKLEDEYLSPEFNITINNAYENFNYYFNVWVDAKGSMTFRNSLIPIMPEFKSELNIMKGIVDGYLKYYIETTPGNTFGIPHTSIIIINVTGIARHKN